jgi:hypothetical protein
VAAEGKPKTFAVAVTGNDLSTENRIFLLRSYPNEHPTAQPGTSACAVWEAGRATGAAPTFFEPQKIGGQGNGVPRCAAAALVSVSRLAGPGAAQT